MKNVQQLMLNERNKPLNPDPFHIFLTDGADVGKIFLVKCLTEYMKKNLKFPKQIYYEEPSLAGTASTEWYNTSDEISMTDNCTFDGLKRWLRAIKRRDD